MTVETLGIYVHVPFCTTRCRYCDFYRVGYRRDRLEEFLTALRSEIDGHEWLHGRAVDSIFLGGGTPSLLTPSDVADLLARLAVRFRLTGDCEISAEANPSDLTPERLRGFRAAGVNRLSIGVQSFQDRELELIGRRHDARGAAAAVEAARSAGFERLSFDLILGLPAQTAAGFRATLDRALELAPEHLSIYMLEVHAGSEIDGLLRRRPALFPGEDELRRRYLLARETLEAHGWRQYEISNFARPGGVSRHNLKYWRCAPVLGLGPAAHSLLDGRRLAHRRDLAAYLADPLAMEELPCDLDEERVFLGLRLHDGLPRHSVVRALGIAPAALDGWVERMGERVVASDGRIRLSPQGWLVSTTVIGELLELPRSGRRARAPEPRAATGRIGS